MATPPPAVTGPDRGAVPRPVALVVALAQERRTLQEGLASALQWWTEDFRAVSGRLDEQPAIVIQAGIGRERARQALLATSRWYSLRAAISLGFAGGLVDALRPGDLVCPAMVLSDDGALSLPFPAAPGQAAVRAGLSANGPRVHDGPLLTVDAPLRAPHTKRAAHQRTGAVAVDMEGAGVAEAAQELGIPWLALKAVVDGVEDPLPEFLAGCTTDRGDLRWRGLLRACLAGGEQRRTLRRLGRASQQAALGLRRGLAVVLAAWSP